MMRFFLNLFPVLIVSTCLLVPIPLQASEHAQDKECVILLHGLARSGYSMLAVEWRLSNEGYAVENITYPSLHYSIEPLANLAVEEGLQGCREQGATPVHVVTHSLGGILLRQYFSEHAVDNFGRAVMLGPPNQGAGLADQIRAVAWLNTLLPPAALQLAGEVSSLPRSLGEVNFEVGIIAGTKNHRPFIMHGVAQASDGTVTVEETKISGMKDFILLPATHTLMMWNSEVLDQVVFFLDSGKFSR